MKAHPILLQMKYARIVACYAKMMDISLAEALDQFYRSDTYQLIHEGVSDMHCFSDTYLAEEIKLEYEKNGVERKYPYCDYELIPQSAWNYGFAGGEMTLEEHGVGDVPFSSRKPPVTLRAAFAPVAWGYADGYETIADAYPRSSRAMGEAVEMEMIPYGCAKLRMTEMPPVRK